MASTTRVLDLVDTEIGIVEGNGELENIQGNIGFNNIKFTYPGRESVLDDITFNIESGETIGLVGSTGSGKTTLIRLLMRFHDPLSGQIEIDNKDIKGLKLSSLRGSIALVSQNTTLFPGTVRENIAYGKPNSTEEEILNAARIAEASVFISELPEGMDTNIGEDGHKLSGGQRQRLAIARAVLKDAPILILDEATSNVDNETEAALQRSIEKISVDRTTLIIAHRLSTIRNADRVIVLDSGSISEEGNHDELIMNNGIYSRLWAVQTGDVGND
jgi:ATP-binding cassette subfamily B protein